MRTCFLAFVSAFIAAFVAACVSACGTSDQARSGRAGEAAVLPLAAGPAAGARRGAAGAEPSYTD